MWMAATAVIPVFVLGLASAIGKARKGRWWTAGAVFLPGLGMVGILLGGVARQSTSFFWLGCLFVAAGFGSEAMAYWRTRTDGSERVVR
ncbi:hypothetical protein OH781_04520 [Streptomyces sp. NBC_01550]|uniref:hypothetical protein n=1 Tax=Streptomyces sp. NBC_01550 TaxID=2975875 RepID=UPI003870E807